MVTVITLPGVDPLPEIISAIEIGSVPNAPTISYSGRCGENPPDAEGYFSVTSLPDAGLNALDNLL